VTFRKKIYKILEELQADLDAWIKLYNEQRPSGQMVLRQDSDADIDRQSPFSQREDDQHRTDNEDFPATVR
jgi:hypothetical protein